MKTAREAWDPGSQAGGPEARAWEAGPLREGSAPAARTDPSGAAKNPAGRAPGGQSALLHPKEKSWFVFIYIRRAPLATVVMISN